MTLAACDITLHHLCWLISSSHVGQQLRSATISARRECNASQPNLRCVSLHSVLVAALSCFTCCARLSLHHLKHSNAFVSSDSLTVPASPNAPLDSLRLTILRPIIFAAGRLSQFLPTIRRLDAVFKTRCLHNIQLSTRNIY